MGFFPPSCRTVRSKHKDEPNKTPTSRVTGVKCLAAAAVTILPTRPEPVYKTGGGVSWLHDTGMKMTTNYGPTAAPIT